MTFIITINKYGFRLFIITINKYDIRRFMIVYFLIIKFDIYK